MPQELLANDLSDSRRKVGRRAGVHAGHRCDVGQSAKLGRNPTRLQSFKRTAVANHIGDRIQVVLADKEIIYVFCDPLEDMPNSVIFWHAGVNDPAQLEDFLNVSCTCFPGHLRSLEKRLLGPLLLRYRVTKSLPNFFNKPFPCGQRCLVVFKPRHCCLVQVDFDVRASGHSVPAVIFTHSFIMSEPFIHVFSGLP